MNAAVHAYRERAAQSQRDQLVLNHLDFVRHIISKLAVSLPPGVDLENLESAGVVGLVEAAHRYDEQRGIQFRTFAYPRIRGAIFDELRRNCPIPQKVMQKIAIIQDALEQLTPPVTPEAIAEHTQLSTEDVERCLEAMRLTQASSWQDAIETYRNHPTDDCDRPEGIAERRELLQMLADCIERLPDDERVVLTLYYMEDLRLKEIGRVLDLSESRISRLLSKAEFRLKEFLRARGAG